MFKDTHKYKAKEFSRLVQRAGGRDNAFTSKDYTAYFQNGPNTELKRWMEMEADLFSFRASDRPEAFLTALDKLGALSRRPRKKSFWRHFSIDRRMKLLERLLEMPKLADRLQRKINALKWALGGLVLAALLRVLLARPELFRLW
jgi:hypothetical protein